MSITGPIRTHIGATIARVLPKMLIADQALAQGVVAAVLAPIVACRAHLHRSQQSVDQKLVEWAAIIAQLAANEREEEEAIFEAFLLHDHSPTEWVVEIAEKIVDLDILIGQLQAPAPQNGLPPINGNGIGHIHLPSLELPTFYGDSNHFFQFWEAFEHSVGQNPNLNDAQKITYLFSRLRGTARSAVEGLPLIATSYPIAVDLLRERYGNVARRAEILQGELIKLPKANNHPSSLRVLSESVERICRQLSTLGIELNTNPFLISTLKEKLPTDVLTRLVEKEMDGGVVWTPLQWRNGLMREVQIREAAMVAQPPLNKAPHQNPQLNHKFTDRRFHPNTNFRPQHNISKSLVRSFPVVTNPRKRSFSQSADLSSGHSNFSNEPGPSRLTSSRKPSGSGSCSLCDNSGHAPSVCPTYPTPGKRQQRMQQQNRCLRCGKAGHQADQCQSRAVCPNCRGAHHVIICKNNGKLGTGANSQPIGHSKHQHSSLAVMENEDLEENTSNMGVFPASNS